MRRQGEDGRLQAKQHGPEETNPTHTLLLDAQPSCSQLRKELPAVWAARSVVFLMSALETDAEVKVVRKTMEVGEKPESGRERTRAGPVRR